MRVGIDARPALFSRTGIGRYVAELVRGLGQLDDDLSLQLFGDAWTEPIDSWRIDTLLRASGATLHRRRIPGRLFNLLGRFGLGVEHRLGGIDLFHHTDLVFPPVRHVPTVVTVQDVVFDIDPSFHGPEFRRDVPGRLRGALSRAAAVIVPSRETLHRVIEHYGVEEERLFLIPHGADHIEEETEPDFGDPEEHLLALGVRRPYVLSVGTIEPRKNHLRLLGAFERVAEKMPHMLVLVGGFGWMCDDVRARLRRLEPGGRVLHLEGLDDRQLPLLYRRAEMSIYPSLYEGFGLPVLESMVRGVPTLTTRRGAIPEVGGDAVVYFEAEDEEAMAEALLRVASDAHLREDLRQRGRERAARFSWIASAREHLRVYQTVR